MVVARSWAEMPVVVPATASTDTAKAVPIIDVFFPTIGWRSSSSRRSPVMETQMSPRPSREMKLIASGVTFPAAMIRSPSFSRVSSSTTMTILPCRMSSIAASTFLRASFMMLTP